MQANVVAAAFARTLAFGAVARFKFPAPNGRQGPQRLCADFGAHWKIRTVGGCEGTAGIAITQRKSSLLRKPARHPAV